MERTTSLKVISFSLVHLITVFIFSSFSNTFIQFCCQHQSSKPAIRFLNSLPKHLKNTRKKDCLQFWDGLKLHFIELSALLTGIHNYYAIFSLIQWKEKRKYIKNGINFRIRLKLTLCNKMTILLQETTQTLCIIFHHSFCLIPFYSLVSFFFFSFRYCYSCRSLLKQRFCHLCQLSYISLLISPLFYIP